MSVETGQWSVGTTPVQIYAGDGAKWVSIHAFSGNAYLGNADVSASTGFLLRNEIQIFNWHSEPVYLVSDKPGGAVVYTFISTK